MEGNIKTQELYRKIFIKVKEYIQQLRNIKKMTKYKYDKTLFGQKQFNRNLNKLFGQQRE